MDDKERRHIQLNCLYEMFRDRIEENVIYIVFTENEGRIDTTIDQLMPIASSSFTGYHFDTKQSSNQKLNTGDDETTKPTILSSSGSNYSKSTSSESGDPENLNIDEQIKELQKSIDDLLSEKKCSHDKASYYLNKKMFPVTGYYSELSSKFERMIQAKTSKLVDLLLEKSQNSSCIDLHGLNPIQARLVVSELLKIRQSKLMIDKQREASIDIITGWGKHSLNQGQRIKPTIVSLLRDMQVEYYKLNKGALRVTIRR